MGDRKNGWGGRKWKKERWKSFGDRHVHIVPSMWFIAFMCSFHPGTQHHPCHEVSSLWYVSFVSYRWPCLLRYNHVHCVIKFHPYVLISSMSISYQPFYPCSAICWVSTTCSSSIHAIKSINVFKFIHMILFRPGSQFIHAIKSINVFKFITWYCFVQVVNSSMSQTSANSIPSIWLSFHIVNSTYKKFFIYVDFLSNAIIFIYPYVKVSYD